MLFLLAATIAAAPEASPKLAAPICDVGRLALRDMPRIDHNTGYARYYGDAGIAGDLLAICPILRTEIPAGFPPADAVAMQRASVHAPVPGETTPRTMIFEVGIPAFSADLKTATVEMGYACTGLCGAGFIARYIRGPDGWLRDGEIRNTFVS
jgi:hypothetical protein